MEVKDTSTNLTQAVLIKDNRIILPNQWEEPVQLLPHQDFKVLVNNRQIYQATDVTKDDQIIIINNVSEIPPSITVTIAPDKLSAAMKLQPQIKTIPDIEVKKTIFGPQIKVISRTQVTCPFTLQDLENALKQEGVVYGIDSQVLGSLLNNLNNPDGEKAVVARGEKAQPGIDEQVKVLFESKADSQPAVLPDGRVDFRQSQITSVDLGEVLAIKLPGQPGKPGMGVDGTPIEPPDYKRVQLRAGAGTMLQGDSVVALESGLPSVTVTQNNWFFQVTPLLQFEDVNLSTGNLEFSGHLRINRDIAEGMSVFATGNIDIGGSVYGAKAVALGNLTVNKNVISSFLTAGATSEYWEDIKKKLYQINKRMSELYAVLQVLHKRCREAGEKVQCGRIVQVVMEKKFADLPIAINELNNLNEAQNITHGNLKAVINQLTLMFRSLRIYKIKDISEIYQMQQRLATAIANLDIIEDESGDITLGYAINSTIEAAGNVRITGKGCINTTINARGNVTVGGVFRGGTITSKGIVKIKEAGSEMGVKTVILTKGKPIIIEKAHPNVIITSGSNSKTTNDTEYKIYFKDDK